MRILTKSKMVLFCAAAPLAVAAQESDEIIVTGLRLPTPATETGSSVSVITADDIELRGYSFAVDALAIAPGVTVNQTGSFGGLSTVSIRGASTDQTLVLLDGVPLGDPTAVGGGYDFSILDVAEIERIEVLKGPQSTLWGSDAIGGVINIITKRPEAGLGARAFAEGGSYKTYRGGASVSGANNVGDFRLAASGITSDGVSKADAADGNGEADAYDGLTLSGYGGLNLPNDIRLDVSARHMTGETEIDGFPPPSFFLLLDTNDFSETEQTTGAVNLIVPLFDNSFENRFMAGYTNIERRGNFGGFATLDQGDRLILRYQGTVDLTDQHRFAFGAEREEAEANGQDTSINGFFGLYEFSPVEDITLSAGLRQDDHSRFGGETTARVAARWAINDLITLRGSWGEGFKAPTIFQLTQTFGALPPNADLQPERSDAFDVGLDVTTPNRSAALSVTFFYRYTENEIIFAPNFRYENLDATKAKGVEATIDTAVSSFVSLSLNYAFIDAEDATTGTRQIRIPRHSGDAALIFGSNESPFRGAVTARYNGRETENLFGADVSEWFRVDLSGSYALSDALEIYGRVENLFDEQYQQISGYGTPGLSAYVGVRVGL